MKIEIKEINKKLKISLLLLLAYYIKIDFNFRSLANRNCLYSFIPLGWMKHPNYPNILCLTSIVSYLHSEFCGKHCCFESAELSQRDSFQTSSLFRSKEDCPCHRDEKNHYGFSFMKSRDMLMTLIDKSHLFSLIGLYILCNYKLCGYLYMHT